MVSIITPAHNEETIIAQFVENAVAFLRRKKISGEVIVIENGSKDNTWEILQNLQKKYKELVIEKIPTGNKGLALKRAFEIARGKKLVTLDTDLWDEKFVEASIKNLDNYDILIGSKSIIGAKDERSFPARFIKWGYNFVMRLFFDFQGTETHAKLSFVRESIIPLVKECKTSELVFDTEPAASFMDADFSWMYSRRPNIDAAKTNIIVSTPNMPGEIGVTFSKR